MQGLDEQDNAGVVGVRQVQSILAAVVAATCVTHRGHFTSPMEMWVQQDPGPFSG